MMAASVNSERLDNALQAWERDLETPIVPGEFPSWIQNLRTSGERVGHELQSTLPTAHEQTFGEIGGQDPDLLSRVQALREEDHDILVTFTSVQRKVQELATTAEVRSTLTNSPEVRERIHQIVQAGLDLVIRIRTQEISLETWKLEAYQRDRGFGD